MAELNARLQEIETELAPQTTELQELGIQLRAMQGNPFLALPYETLQLQANKLSEQIKTLRREQSQNSALSETLARRAQKLRAGILDDPRAHITHLGKPVSLARLRFNRLADAWAAVSISALLLGIVAIIVFQPELLLAGAGMMIIVFILLESLLRGTYINTINTIAVLLALAATVILVVKYWQLVLIISLIVIAVFLLVQKMRELRE